jgi:GNAT superfamily N-acetyltransferase
MITIRPYHLSDRPALHQVIDCVCLECGLMETPRFQPSPAWERALAHPDDSHFCLLLACADDRAVGWCRLFPVDPDQRRGALELGIGLLASYRGYGTGTRLLRAALEWAQSRGAPEVRLWTRTENTSARRLFAHFHFQTVCQQGGRIWMTLPLARAGLPGNEVLQEETVR